MKNSSYQLTAGGCARAAITICIALLMAAPGPVRGQDRFALTMPTAQEPIRISADQVVWTRADNSLELSGEVVLEHPDYLIRADRARADLDARIIQAEGNVRVETREAGEVKELLSADQVEINTDQETGWMVHARLELPWKQGAFQFQGERWERIDEHTYLIEKGSFTWCQCREGEVPDWRIEADTIRADTEGDAEFRGARVRIRERPLFKVPYFRYPITTERQSGFLFPEIKTSSSDGFQFELPYYWVINQSADLTVMPRWIEERGIDLGAELRWNYGEIAKGETRAAIIDDSKEHAVRGGVRVIHRTDLGDDYTIALDITYITDNEVLFDLDHREFGNENQRALESRLVLARHWSTMNLTAEFSVFDDLMGGDVRTSPLGQDRDREMVQRLPALQYTLLTAPLIGPIMFDLQGYAVNYWRQELELGRGQMVSFLPRVAIPYRLFETVDFWAALGYRGWITAPDPEFDSTSSAVSRPEAELAASVQFERVFMVEDQMMRHAVRPAFIVYYAGEPGEVKDEFFRELLPDRETRLVGLHLDNRFWARPADKRRRPAVEIARIELTQFYDDRAHEWQDLRIEARLGEPSPWRISLDAYHSWEEAETSKLIAGAGYVFNQNAEVRVGYRYDSGRVRTHHYEFLSSQDEALTGGFMVRPAPRHTLEYRTHYSLEHGRMVRQSLEWDYLARQKCWGLTMRITDRVRPADPDGDHEISGSFLLRVTSPDDF